MAQSITLTASMRSNLASLKSIQGQMDTTQERLSTGKKVNSAIDNASSYYQARSLTNRASDLDALLDSMGQGIQTIQAANEGIEAVTAFVDQLKSVANSAFALDPTNETYENSIKSYQTQFDTIQEEISKLVKDSSYQGINLLTGGKLTVTFNETRSNRFTVQGEDIVAGMGIKNAADWEAVETTTVPQIKATVETAVEVKAAADPDPAVTIAAGAEILTNEAGDEIAIASDGKYYNVASKAEVTDTTGYTAKMIDDPDATPVTVKDYSASIDKTIGQISIAVDYLRSYATELGNNFSIIETRQNFTESLIDVLETGADNLVLADMNEESANYLALQTRQQLAINSLSLASQSAQAVLSLF